MERETLSFRQLMTLLWCALLSPAAELLPGGAARLGTLGALSVLAAGVVLAASGALCARVARLSGGLAQSLLDCYGRWAGTALLYIYIVWGELLLVLRLELSAKRLLGAGERDGTLWFFLIVLAAAALWIARGHLAAMGRTGELMFLAVALTAAAVLLLALFQVQGINLLPQQAWSVQNAAEAALPGLKVFSWAIFVPFLFQPTQEKYGGAWLRWMALGCLALAAAQLIILGNFGPVLTQRLNSPFFQLAKSVGVEGAFQRVESIVSAVWTFSDLCLLAGIIWMVRRVAAALWPKANSQKPAAVAVLPAAVIALALSGERSWVLDIARRLLPVGSMILGLAVPFIALFLKWSKSKRG